MPKITDQQQGATATAGTVPVGIASTTGYGVAIVSLIAAVLAYVLGNHSQAQLGSIVAAAVGVISLLVTQIGRYVQANSQIKGNIELKRLETEAASIVGTVERVDPQANAQLEAVIRGVLREEISRLPGTAGVVAADVENVLLPTPEEEAAEQPPAASTASAGGH